MSRFTHTVRVTIATLLLLITAHPVSAQQEQALEYTKEVGVGLGLGYTLSDFHTSWPKDNKFSGEAIMRFVISPRMAVKTTLGVTGISGSTEGKRDFYPATPDPTATPPATSTTTDRLIASASGAMIDLNALYELHFLPYGWYRNYLGHKRVTPYLQFGAGFLYSTAGKAFTIDLPIGVGVKLKVARRLNLGLDWAFHFTPSDKLDAVSNPTGINTSGFRGKDFYTKTMLTLTYDISPKCPTCNKAD